MLVQGKALNLVLTGIVARMAESPHPLLHAYLFPAAALRGGAVPWPNVVSTLRKVGTKCALLCTLVVGHLRGSGAVHDVNPA